jgi:glutamate racemase
MHTKELPIGVFDSGIGGLTVVRQIRNLLPNEEIFYLGDTARVPYGTKSQETVIRFACEDAQFLLDKGVKAIVVACNTASAWSLPVLERRFGLPICGVIQPGAEAALIASRNKRVGVIGTAATVRSKAYKNAMRDRFEKVQVYAQACPLLVPLAEEGWFTHPVTLKVLEEYLMPLVIEQRNVDPGCTHYLFLSGDTQGSEEIAPHPIHLVDSPRAARHSGGAAELDLSQPLAYRPIHPYVTMNRSLFQMARQFLAFPSNARMVSSGIEAERAVRAFRVAAGLLIDFRQGKK